MFSIGPLLCNCFLSRNVLSTLKEATETALLLLFLTLHHIPATEGSVTSKKYGGIPGTQIPGEQVFFSAVMAFQPA